MDDTYTSLNKQIKETLALAEEKFNVAFPMPTILPLSHEANPHSLWPLRRKNIRSP